VRRQRLLDVTASTTLDHVVGSVRGPEWREESIAVLDVAVPEDEPAAVDLAVEFDPGSIDRVEPHAACLSLTPEQARTLAAALEDAADRLETEE
jgi:hypothetical protein